MYKKYQDYLFLLIIRKQAKPITIDQNDYGRYFEFIFIINLLRKKLIVMYQSASQIKSKNFDLYVQAQVSPFKWPVCQSQYGSSIKQQTIQVSSSRTPNYVNNVSASKNKCRINVRVVPRSVAELLQQQNRLKIAHRENYRQFRVKMKSGKEAQKDLVKTMDWLQRFIIQVQKMLYHIQYRERQIERKEAALIYVKGKVEQSSNSENKRLADTRLEQNELKMVEELIIPRIKSLKEKLFSQFNRSENRAKIYKESSKQQKTVKNSVSEIFTAPQSITEFIPQTQSSKEVVSLQNKLREAENYIYKMQQANYLLQKELEQFKIRFQTLQKEKNQKQQYVNDVKMMSQDTIQRIFELFNQFLDYPISLICEQLTQQGHLPIDIA